MTAPPALPTRRGWCPGVRRPVATGDGLLVRIHPQGGVLAAAQARLLAELAQECGNGHLEVSSRSNMQLRGVRESTYTSLVRRIEEAGLLEP